MTLDKLQSLNRPRASRSRPNAKVRRIPVAALPIGLLLAFIALFALLFLEPAPSRLGGPRRTGHHTARLCLQQLQAT